MFGMTKYTFLLLLLPLFLYSIDYIDNIFEVLRPFRELDLLVRRELGPELSPGFTQRIALDV